MLFNSTKNQVKSILTKSLFNMREASRSLSLDEFILNTIESLMQIEREEYLEAAKNQGLSDKSNGFYKRNPWFAEVASFTINSDNGDIERDAKSVVEAYNK